MNRNSTATGVTPISLLFFRFTLAAVIMIGIARMRGEAMPRRRTLLGFALMGGVGYVGQSLSYFTALTMANAGFVALLSAIFHGERLTRYRIFAAVLALAGAALTVGPQLDARPLRVLLGIGAALICSVYIMAGTSLLRGAAPIASSAVTLPTGTGGWIGVVAIVVAVTTFLMGLKLIGPTHASGLSTLEPVTTVVLSALLLGESIGLWTAVGGALILAGALMLSRKAPSHRISYSECRSNIVSGTGAKISDSCIIFLLIQSRVPDPSYPFCLRRSAKRKYNSRSSH